MGPSSLNRDLMHARHEAHLAAAREHRRATAARDAGRPSPAEDAAPLPTPRRGRLLRALHRRPSQA